RYPTPVELVRPSLVRRAYDWGTSHAGGRRIVAAAKDILRGNRRHTHGPVSTSGGEDNKYN
ncbi:MAG TPA: hypothetical protein VH141_26055, partial [Pseudonocardia sp.]|nr:hypothetical protein [Pseudonocardia sp.]